MLIYLDGTSSSGKSSIAKQIQEKIKEPILYFSIDNVLGSLPERDLKAIKGETAYSYEIDWKKLIAGYYSSVSALIDHGNMVIADCPIYDPKIASYYSQIISRIKKNYLVKVKCSLEILEERESTRGDRAKGLAKKQFKKIHSFFKYDIEVESDRFAANELADQIVEKIMKTPR